MATSLGRHADGEDLKVYIMLKKRVETNVKNGRAKKFCTVSLSQILLIASSLGRHVDEESRRKFI